jgi:hypothetical protein
MAAHRSFTTAPPHTPVQRRFDVTIALHRFVSNNWKVGLYVLLILLCVLFAPEKPLRFIYTEF